MQIFSLFINFVLSMALLAPQVPITIHKTEVDEPDHEPTKALTITNKNLLEKKEEVLGKTITIKKVENEDSQSDKEEKTTDTDNTSPDEKDTSEDQLPEEEDNAEDDTVEIDVSKVDPNEAFVWDGPVITPASGVNDGPSGFETYYNLPMGGVVQIMREKGFSEEEYPYWVREDGCKMLGDYIMVAADLDLRPEGTILPCSLGMAMVCDTGDFIYSNRYQLDIAVNW